MQLMEAQTSKPLEEFVGGKITLANAGTTRGTLLVRGTLMEVIPRDDERMTVKYTIDEFAYGELNDANSLTWQDANGIATWTGLRSKHQTEDDGALFFGEPTPAGHTARITAPSATAHAA